MLHPFPPGCNLYTCDSIAGTNTCEDSRIVNISTVHLSCVPPVICGSKLLELGYASLSCVPPVICGSKLLELGYASLSCVPPVICGSKLLELGYASLSCVPPVICGSKLPLCKISHTCLHHCSTSFILNINC